MVNNNAITVLLYKR